jgi:hypothetical protein
MAQPHPTQVWSHATNSTERLRRALADPKVSAIEADVRVDLSSGEPMMTHDPAPSDLTLSAFLDTCAGAARPVHVKLDIKEQAAVAVGIRELAPRLRLFKSRGQCVWVNADVLPGPGKREPDQLIDAEELIRLVLAHCTPVPVLSLGWRVGLSPFDRYTQDDINCMLALLERTGLHRFDSQLVFAVWVRMVLRDPVPILSLLTRLSGAQLLVWSATGELPLSHQVSA